ncbi:MAG: four helix bundle protein [Bacteroidales bacterium]|nr:four helix bundle protein [Bacteroidales bacterium]
MALFRFENMDIWKMAIDISDELFDVADDLEERKRFRFAEQLRAAGMSMSNNISEGSGSYSDKDFANFLKFSRRSVYECANIMVIIEKRKCITEVYKIEMMEKLAHLSKMITNFRKTLL